MPVKKEILESYLKRFQKAILDFLKKSPNEAFSGKEIFDALDKIMISPERRMFSDEVKYSERMITINVILDKMCRDKKVKKYVYNGEALYCIRNKRFYLFDYLPS